MVHFKITEIFGSLIMINYTCKTFYTVIINLYIMHSVYIYRFMIGQIHVIV